jgi:GT2 family glycosyltransferase
MTAHLMMITYNRLELTKQTIESLYNNKNNTEFKLSIVDNFSSDQTQDYLLELKNKYDINLIFNSENKGIARGRNQNLKYCTDQPGDWFATLDNDVLLSDNWLDECIDILSKNKDYAMIGVNFEDTNYPLITKNEVTFQNKPKGNLGTACMVFNRNLFNMIGYFCEEYSNFYGCEDSNYGMRTRVLGFKLGYLKQNGTHLGVGEHDKGAYREFKTKEHDQYVPLFNQHCREYYQRTKPIYIPFKE